MKSKIRFAAFWFSLTAVCSAVAMPYTPQTDLQAGFRLSVKVRMDTPNGDSIQPVVSKGDVHELGGWLLRVNPAHEGGAFAFFANTDGSAEPRVSGLAPVETGRVYSVEAGWDGTNAWLSVDGVRWQKLRRGIGARCFAPIVDSNPTMRVSDLAFAGPSVPMMQDAPLEAGLTFATRVSFTREITGECTLFERPGQYMLRYDRKRNAAHGAFNFFVFLSGAWESRASISIPCETGRVYAVTGHWSGSELRLFVDDHFVKVRRWGRVAPSAVPLKKRSFPGHLDGLVTYVDRRARATIGDLRTVERMPLVGEGLTVQATLINAGVSVSNASVVARVPAGETVVPARMDIGELSPSDERDLTFRIGATTNATVPVHLSFYAGKRKVAVAQKCFTRMPTDVPARAARSWQPPVRPTKTYYVDSCAGDDAHNGLSPEQAWRTFARVKGLALGPGERLLLRRGSVWDEALEVKAHGTPENWAEIGAYGEGRRPQIDRHKRINDFCGYVKGAKCLVVHDLVFCNAGGGFLADARSEEGGDVVVERCLAHHIEGLYRTNAHGFPEWWNAPGPACAARSRGISVSGRRVMLRDCEAYQCSSGWSVSGMDAIATRMLSHDNYAHNTSPHPYFLASRSWMTDCVFDASGWHASAGTMGVMLANNIGFVIRGCHFINQPDSGSPDQGGIDFEAGGDNCRVENCTFRNNSGAAIEVLGLRSPQTHNVVIRGCKFDHNNRQLKNGPAEIQVWGGLGTPPDIACASGLIEGNGYSLVPGVPFYVNETAGTNRWTLVNNRAFDFTEELDAAFPYPEPPHPVVCEEIWTDEPKAALAVRGVEGATVRWEALEGPLGVTFDNAASALTKATFPTAGDYRLHVAACRGNLPHAAHTAVHVLPKGGRVFKAWTFAKNLDREGWRAENLGTAYKYLPAENSFWSTESFPVCLVCGDYFVITVDRATQAAIVTPDEVELGVEAVPRRANAFRVRLQNHTNARRMRLYWQTASEPSWQKVNSAAFDVQPNDEDDRVYTVTLPRMGSIKQLKLAFSDDSEPITGTIRIDYMALLRL